MESSRDVFIVAIASAANPAEALGLAIKESGVNPARVQDFIFGADSPILFRQDDLASELRMNCPMVIVSSSLRALCFATQSILTEDADLILVGGSDGEHAAALLLASPASIGIYNLTPLARLDARSLTSVDQALKKASLDSEDIQIKLQGTCGVLLAVQVIEQLQKNKASWGLAQVEKAVILIESI